MSQKSEFVPLEPLNRNFRFLTGDNHYGSTRRKSSLGSFEAVTLSWKDVTVQSSERKTTRRRLPFTRAESKMLINNGATILRHVTGIAESGTLTAIMGSSGAGKTTLLHTLNNRLHGMEVTGGTILLNGQPIGTSMAQISGYVQQDEMFFSCLKVKEHLYFQARLRMDAKVPRAERFRRVTHVLEILGLSKCADTIIGDPDRGIIGISGGERRRLSFASEVLTNPPLLFCDEPTSGLDSFMAQNVVETLRSLASEGRTILTTIHQPSSEVFELFDRILLLANGRTVFLGNVKDALIFFSGLGYDCPKNYNPADFLVEVLSSVPGREFECREKIEIITDLFAKSATAKKLIEKIQPAKMEENTEKQVESSPYKASFCEQVSACTWRAYLSEFRDPTKATVYLFNGMLVAFVIGALYFQTDRSQDGILNINGCLFIFITNSAFQFSIGTCKVFPLELPMIKREYFNGMYSLGAYFIARLFSDFPFRQFALPCMSITIIYWSVGLYPTFHCFMMATLITILVANVSVSFGYFMSAVCNDMQIALSVTPPVLMPFMLLGGLFINIGDLPLPLQWCSYLSWFRLAFEGLLINQWTDHYSQDCRLNGTLTAPCYIDGKAILETYSFSKSNFMMDITGLIAMAIVYRLLSFVVVVFRCRRKTT